MNLLKKLEGSVNSLEKISKSDAIDVDFISVAGKIENKVTQIDKATQNFEAANKAVKANPELALNIKQKNGIKQGYHSENRMSYKNKQ